MLLNKHSLDLSRFPGAYEGMTGEETNGTRLSPDLRRAIRESALSNRALAKNLGINPKTVAKWRQRPDLHDRPSGPARGGHRRLSAEEVEIIVRFRQHTLLPLDDCLYALQARIPQLTRSTLHRCLQERGISTLRPPGDGMLPASAEALGQFDVEIVEVRSADGPLQVIKAIESVSKFVFVQLRQTAGANEAADFLAAVLDRYPGTVRRVRTAPAPPFASGGPFGQLCREHGIEQEIAEQRSVWSEGSAATLARALDNAPEFSSADFVARFLREFADAYNFRRRLKKLGGRTPIEVIRAAWRLAPERFRHEPDHETMGLEITPDHPARGV